MLQESNPAYRLLNALDMTENVMASNDGNHHKWSYALSKCYNFHPNDFENASRTASSLAKLPKEIENLVRASPANDFLIPDDCLGWVPSVTSTLENLGWQMNTSAKTSIEALNKHHAPMIKISGGIIDKYKAEMELNQDNVMRVLTDLRSLIKEVEKLDENDIPPHVKAFLLNQLDILERALIDCRLMGREVLYNSVADAFGRFQFHPKLADEVEKTSVWPKVKEALGAVILVSASVGAATQLPSQVIKLLPQGVVEELQKIESGESDGNPPLIEEAK